MTPENFHRIRKYLKLTRPQLAELLGFSRQAVWQWETNKRPIPEYATRALILVDDLWRAERFQRQLERRVAELEAELERREDGYV